jgi:hypothetical protein
LQELQIGLRLLQSTFLKAKSGTFSKILWTSQPSPLNLSNKIGYKNLVSGGGTLNLLNPPWIGRVDCSAISFCLKCEKQAAKTQTRYLFSETDIILI